MLPVVSGTSWWIHPGQQGTLPPKHPHLRPRTRLCAQSRRSACSRPVSFRSRPPSQGSLLVLMFGFKAQYPFVPLFFRTAPTKEDGRNKE